MAAVPESGRSDQGNLGQMRVRFRPEADIHATRSNELLDAAPAAH